MTWPPNTPSGPVVIQPNKIRLPVDIHKSKNGHAQPGRAPWTTGSSQGTEIFVGKKAYFPKLLGCPVFWGSSAPNSGVIFHLGRPPLNFHWNWRMFFTSSRALGASTVMIDQGICWLGTWEEGRQIFEILGFTMIYALATLEISPFPLFPAPKIGFFCGKKCMKIGV